MENTKEWKERFFALYWGQDVLCSDMYGEGGTIYSPTMRTDSSEDRWLELKPLQSISDENAIEIGYDNKEQAVKLLSYGDKDSYDVDYLRSKGYALPFMGVDVETLVSWGWVKLKTD